MGKSWRPNWRDENGYPDPKKNPSLDQWAWEFLRRNPEYLKRWNELEAMDVEKRRDKKTIFAEEFDILNFLPPWEDNREITIPIFKPTLIWCAIKPLRKEKQEEFKNEPYKFIEDLPSYKARGEKFIGTIAHHRRRWQARGRAHHGAS